MALIRRHYQIFIDRAPDAVFAFFADPRNHARISPSGQEEELRLETIAGTDGGEAGTGLFTDGARATLRASGALARPMTVEVGEWNPPHGFILRQAASGGNGAFTAWAHRRKLTPFQTGTLLRDEIEYAVAAGPLGALADKAFLGARLDKAFHHRQAEAKRLLERIGRIKGRD